jgi:hypothetical protein
MGGQVPYGYDEALKIHHLGSPEHPILSELLDTVGDGSGTKDMATSADTYLLAPPAGLLYVIDAIHLVITDGAALDVDGWGSLAALTLGCNFDIKQGVAPVSAHDFTSGVTLKSHGHLARLGPIEFTSTALGCIARVHICENTPFRLDGDRDETLVFQTLDDLTALSSMEVGVFGRVFYAKG